MKKRLYTDVAVIAHGEGFAITLDGRVLKTPEARVLATSRPPLAEAIADEWQAQGDVILPATMALTRYVSTAIDRVAFTRERFIDEMVHHVDTDLLCYRAEFPDDLIALQNTHWDPMINWAHDRFGVRFLVGRGIMPFCQSDAHHRALRSHLECQSDLHLTALGDLAAMAGSLLIAVAGAEGHLDADRVFALSHLEEMYQVERWGEDEQARTRRENLRNDIGHATRLLRMEGTCE